MHLLVPLQCSHVRLKMQVNKTKIDHLPLGKGDKLTEVGVNLATFNLIDSGQAVTGSIKQIAANNPLHFLSVEHNIFKL